MTVHKTGDLHFLINLRAAEGIGAQLLYCLDGGGDLVGRQMHHVEHGTTDDIVQCHQDGQGEEGPQAAAHGVDPFPFVQLLHFLIVLYSVVAILLLQPRHLCLHGVHLHHALFAFVRQGKENDFRQQGKHDQSQGIAAAADLIQPQ